MGVVLCHVSVETDRVAVAVVIELMPMTPIMLLKRTASKLFQIGQNEALLLGTVAGRTGDEEEEEEKGDQGICTLMTRTGSHDVRFETNEAAAAATTTTTRAQRLPRPKSRQVRVPRGTPGYGLGRRRRRRRQQQQRQRRHRGVVALPQASRRYALFYGCFFLLGCGCGCCS